MKFRPARLVPDLFLLRRAARRSTSLHRPSRSSYRPHLLLLEERLPLGEGVLGLLASASLLGAQTAPPAIVQPAPYSSGEPGVCLGEPGVLTPWLSTTRAFTRPARPDNPSAGAFVEAAPAPTRAALPDLFTSAAQPASRRVSPEPAETRLAPLAPAAASQFGSMLVSVPPVARPADGVLLAALAGIQQPATPATGNDLTPTQEARVTESFGKLPLYFEENVGQTDASVHFFTRGPGYGLYLTSTEAVMVLDVAGSASDRTTDPASDRLVSDRLASDRLASDRLDAGRAEPHTTGMNPVARPEAPPAVVRLQLVGANATPSVTGHDEQPGKVNYFLGNDPSKWHTNISTFGRVEYADVYPGIDLVWYGNQNQLEYDFVVSPGADPSLIRLNVSGAERLEIDAAGDLLIHAGEPGRVSAGSTLRQHKPFVYQEVNGTRQEVASRFVLDGGQVRFAVAAYDTGRPLVIDPVLSYSTYLGGNDDDLGWSVAVDPITGDAYVSGDTRSANFPIAEPYQPVRNGFRDVFVTRLTADGSALVFSTYLGGRETETGRALAVDATGNAVVAGHTTSLDFPTVNPLQPEFAGGLTDAFVARLTADGSALEFSTYLGGREDEWVSDITADPTSGDVSVAGTVESPNFPTVNAFQPVFGGVTDAFVARLTADGSALVFSTYLGGSNADYGNGVRVDPNTGDAYVTGQTRSPDFPIIDPLQAEFGGLADAYVARLSADGSVLVFSTYLGGRDYDNGTAIDVDPSTGQASVTGLTQSPDFPTANALQPQLGGGSDAFVAQLTADGAALVFSTYLGGSGRDAGAGIALDAAGNVVIAGDTSSRNFPTVNPWQPEYGGGINDCFVTQITADGSTLIWSTYHGGPGTEFTFSLAVDGAGNTLVTGYTSSSEFPTVNAFQPTLGGRADAFVFRIGSSRMPPPVPVPAVPVNLPRRHPVP